MKTALRMIIVDDERIIRETIRSLINWKALDVEIVGTCKDGIEAYNAILDEYPDIVLTDIKMPGFSGLELIENIKKIDSDIEFIILTGYEEFAFAKTAMRFGIRHYLLKPCNEKQIVEAVKEIQKSISKRNSDWKLRSDEIYDIYKNDMTGDSTVSSMEKLLNRIQEADLQSRKKIFIDMGKILETVTDKEFLVFLLSGLLIKYADRRDIAYSPMQIMDYVMELKRMNTTDEILSSFLKTLPVIFPPMLIGTRSVADFISKLIAFVETHIDEQSLSLKYISEHYLFMNVDYVSKQFVKQTGYRFSDFLNRKRVEKAKQLLTVQADVQISDVAEKIGFGNNPQYFYLIFKKYTGMTPMAYINSWKNKMA
ncbi:response regulator [Treponema parvum]|uniref:Response regulator n=1 Tax=Treponema parvum TaxID=138851 RepID=A0A975F0H3_9SPIR|nr:response regulator [Treponema parvum]QTQ11814.1 response regulator [Treponema parvum]